MKIKTVRKLFLGFINIHILYHAKKEPFFGSWMIDELRRHGYQISAGTLYPILHSLEKEGLIKVENRNVEGKIRKYYSITPLGEDILIEAREEARELFSGLKESSD